eukprot:TRINITY_DN782127_c0_g1_i1.p1 TRINITY_DN782127_c0_g1~~TRINITY_DN782127_c0_g1_i1.p1  ORF type:complete len:201 (-),score=46.45 TRINITY_DN782127_c0_g1_i1:106-708(-)
MRFKFCGDLDPPDWILAEIAVISRFDAENIQNLTENIIQDIIGKALNFKMVEKMRKKLKMERTEMKAAIACIRHILESSSRFNVTSAVLQTELEQLGLPKANSSGLVKAYDGAKLLRPHFERTSLSFRELEDLDWKVTTSLASSESIKGLKPAVVLHLETSNDGTSEETVLECSEDKFLVLHQELLNVKAKLESMELMNV